MFEALQLLQRIRDYFGDECVVSLGIFQHMACLSVSWGDRAMCNFDLPIETSQSALTNDILERTIIQHIENSYKIWEVGEV